MNDGGHLEAIDLIIAFFLKRKKITFMLDADELRCNHSKQQVPQLHNAMVWLL